MSTLTIVLLVILVVLFVFLAIIFTRVVSSKKDGNSHGIHVSGGASLDDGRVTTDKNYFKGLSDNLGGTIVTNNNYRQPKAFNAALVNKSTGKRANVYINDIMVIGRVKGDGIYSIESDTLVSKKHCKLIVRDNKLFISDLNSTNHTFVNGKKIYQDFELHNGDCIKIGNTRLEVKF